MNDPGPSGLTEAPAPLLEGRKIEKWYGGLGALKQVDIAVYPSEIVGIVGPNGSGKTTLFDCLTRIQPVSSGRVFFRGRDITRMRSHQVARMGLARNFQSIRVYRKLSLVDNLLLSRDWSGERLLGLLRPSSPISRRRADDLLGFLTLGELRDEPAGSLSWGQRRLLELGMVLMPDPELILLDEATSGINPALVDVIKDRIRVLNRSEGKTIVLIEHDVDLVVDLCNRVVVLDYGEQLAEGSAVDVFRSPAVIDAYLGADPAK